MMVYDNLVYKLRIQIRLLMGVLLLMGLAACGGDKGVNLSESITTVRQEYGTTTLNYPEGWAAEINSSGVIQIANHAEMLANFNAHGPHPLEKDQRIIIVVGIPDALAPVVLNSQSVTLAALIQSYSEYLTTNDADLFISLGQSVDFEGNGQFGQVNSGTLMNSNGQVGAAFMASYASGGYVILFGMSAFDEQQQLIDMMKAMIATARVS